MEIKDFIGKVVVSSETKRRFFICEITSPEIILQTIEPDANGHHTRYRCKTINGDPITNGDLFFEDSSLNELFKTAYDEYSRTEDAYWEEYGYWMRRD